MDISLDFALMLLEGDKLARESRHEEASNIYSAMAALEDEEAITQITAVRGFGRWSAEIYLMFSLGRPDVFPADDLALQVGLQKLYRLPEKPTPKEARALSEHWSPRRSAGSLFLWHYYAGAPT